MNHRNVYTRVTLAAVLLLVVGCGSDGGTTLAPLAITSANAQMVAQQGVGATDVLMEMGGMVEGYTAVFDNPTPQVIPCDYGKGEVTVDDQGEPGLTTGDSATITFGGCVIDADGIPITMSGSISFKAITVTPTGFALTCFFDNYSITVLGTTVIVHGGFTLELNSDDGDTFTAVVHGESFAVTAQAGVQAFAGSITNFRLERTYTESTGAYSVSNQATIAGTELGGEVTFETTVPFTGTDPNDPDAGTLIVTGADGCTATIIALNNVDVQILVDLEGDGEIDATINTTWAVLNDDS